MSVWNFAGLQRKLKSLSKTDSDGETLYPPAAIDLLLDVIARSIPVDQEFYLKSNPDLERAHKDGVMDNVAAHFIEHGFYEDRPPVLPEIDEADYFRRYPDVAEAMKGGKIQSASEHWLDFGRFEDRVAFLYACATPKGSLRIRPAEMESETES